MMMPRFIERLWPTIPVKLVGLEGSAARWNGDALAHAWFDYGEEHDLKWLCACENGEWFLADNFNVRAHNNLSFGRANGAAL